MIVDLTKPIITRGSRTRVTILKVLDQHEALGDGDRIIGLVHYGDGAEVMTWDIDGFFYRQSGGRRLDLVNE